MSWSLVELWAAEADRAIRRTATRLAQDLYRSDPVMKIYNEGASNAEPTWIGKCKACGYRYVTNLCPHTRSKMPDLCDLPPGLRDVVRLQQDHPIQVDPVDLSPLGIQRPFGLREDGDRPNHSEHAYLCGGEVLLDPNSEALLAVFLLEGYSAIQDTDRTGDLIPPTMRLVIT